MKKLKVLIDISINDIANLLAGKAVKYSTEKLIGETIEIEVKLNDEKSNIKQFFKILKIKWIEAQCLFCPYADECLENFIEEENYKNETRN